MDAFSEPGMGGVARKQIFPPCLSLGKRKLGLGSCIRAHLSTERLEKGAALAHRESVRSAGPLKLFPVRLTLAGGVVWQA